MTPFSMFALWLLAFFVISAIGNLVYRWWEWRLQRRETLRRLDTLFHVRRYYESEGR